MSVVPQQGPQQADSAEWWRSIAQKLGVEIHRLKTALAEADRDLHEWLRFARRQMTEMPDWEHTPYGPTSGGVAETVRVRSQIRDVLAALSASRIDPPVPSPGGDTEAPIVIPGSIQKGLTVVLVPDLGAQQADAALAAMKNGTQAIVMAASEMFFHQLRLRVAQDDALADKIAVFYAVDGKLEPVGLRFVDELRWPVGFLQSAWEKETDIRAHRATSDEVCKHGTAMDVHCCNCHSGFIFDNNHECPERAND